MMQQSPRLYGSALLACNARNLVLARKAAEAAHHRAPGFAGLGPAWSL
jgi:hypothetical protein